MANVARACTEEFNIAQESLYALKINTKLEDLKQQFLKSRIFSKLDNYIDKKNEKLQRDSLRYLRKIYLSKHRKLFMNLNKK